MDAPVNNRGDYPTPTAPSLSSSSMPWKKRLMLSAGILLGYLIICWILAIYDSLAPSDAMIARHGIIPRTAQGLFGILLAPLLNGSISPMLIGSLGIIILGGLLLLASFKTFGCVTAFVWIFAGLVTWIIGRSNYSFFGSGILCWGWLAYLIVTPFFARPIAFKPVGLAVGAGLVYGLIYFGLSSTSGALAAWELLIGSILAGVVASVGYWYLYLRYLRRKWFEYRGAPRQNVEAPAEDVQQSTTGSAAVLTAVPAAPPSTYAPNMKQTNRLLEPEQIEASPFGQDTFTSQPSAYGNTSAEPAWLHSNSSSPQAYRPPQPTPTAAPQAPIQYPSQSPFQPTTNSSAYAHSSSNPSWLSDSGTNLPQHTANSSNYNPFG